VEEHSCKEIAEVYPYQPVKASISWTQVTVAKPDIHISVMNLPFQYNNNLYFGVENPDFWIISEYHFYYAAI